MKSGSRPVFNYLQCFQKQGYKAEAARFLPQFFWIIRFFSAFSPETCIKNVSHAFIKKMR